MLGMLGPSWAIDTTKPNNEAWKTQELLTAFSKAGNGTTPGWIFVKAAEHADASKVIDNVVGKPIFMVR